jgi:hypothetical protein
MIKVYYNTLSDYQNTNKFNDLIEGNNNAEYNSFLSASYVDFYYKVNDRLQTLNLGMADIIPLSVSGMRLKPYSFNISKVNNNSVTITYDTLLQTAQINTTL